MPPKLSFTILPILNFLKKGASSFPTFLKISLGLHNCFIFIINKIGSTLALYKKMYEIPKNGDCYPKSAELEYIVYVE